MDDRQTRHDELTRQRERIGRRIRQIEHNERRETRDGETDNAQANAFYLKCGWGKTRTFTDDLSGAEKTAYAKDKAR